MRDTHVIVQVAQLNVLLNGSMVDEEMSIEAEEAGITSQSHKAK